MIEAWGITNTDIGKAFSAYGFSAMISYILGGPFADKYSPRALMAISLLATALGAIGLYLFPSANMLIATYFFFGISTIFLMWGALIKVTHISGGEENRATAMGILDSGRGLIAAIMSSVLVFAVSKAFPTQELSEISAKALGLIYLLVIIFTALIAMAIFLSLKGKTFDGPATHQWSFEKAKIICKDSKIWLLAIIILSSYCGYKSVDNYSIYLVDVLKEDLESSSVFTSLIFWLRPISALIAGIAADKLHQKYPLGRFSLLFFFLLLSGLFQGAMAINLFSGFSLIFGCIIFTATFAYALRSIYFSIFGDLKIEDSLIGTTVGIVSFIGFLPDMFFGLITGHLIDTYPGAPGYQYTFGMTAIFLLLGAGCAFFLKQKTKISAKSQSESLN